MKKLKISKNNKIKTIKINNNEERLNSETILRKLEGNLSPNRKPLSRRIHAKPPELANHPSIHMIDIFSLENFLLDSLRPNMRKWAVSRICNFLTNIPIGKQSLFMAVCIRLQYTKNVSKWVLSIKVDSRLKSFLYYN